MGGKFTQVKQRDGTVVANVSNLAVFDSKTNKYENIAPKLGGTDSEVWDMTGTRTTSTVALGLIASKVTLGTTSQGTVRKSEGPAKGWARED